MHHPLMVSDMASPYTKLSKTTKSGRRFGRCPFCHGKTETFAVSDRENTFFCYACGVGGNAKDLYSLLHGIPKTSEADRFAAAAAAQKDSRLMLSIYESAARFYYNALINGKNSGSAYLSGRGIGADTMTAYGLGYAPDGYDILYRHLSGTYSLESLLSSGLVRLDKNGKPYDFFRSRVMFPVFDRNGDVIAFGGRALNEKYGPKYINSAESEIFNKRRNLYGYPYASSGRGRKLIICEGYMDLIAIQEKAGVPDSAAVLGTALTKEHAEIIAADYDEVCLSLDSDAAGIHAAKQSVGILRQYGISVTIPDYQPFKDPDEFIRKAGVKAFEERIAKAVPADVFCARHADGIGELVDIMAGYFSCPGMEIQDGVSA